MEKHVPDFIDSHTQSSVFKDPPQTLLQSPKNWKTSPYVFSELLVFKISVFYQYLCTQIVDSLNLYKLVPFVWLDATEQCNIL